MSGTFSYSGHFPNYNTPRLSLQFDFIGELGVFEQHLGQTYAAGIANPNDASFHGKNLRQQRAYNVITE